MHINAISVAAVIVIILTITTTGCIEPPKIGGSAAPTPAASKTPSGIYNPFNPTPTPTIQSYVTIVTLFETTRPVQVVTTQGYTVFPVPSPVPEDLTCLIYTNSGPYTYNTSAFTFDLKNPPMYIDYSVTTNNITESSITSKSQTDITTTWTDFSPDAWFLVTVRNKTTGNILVKNGFGPALGYSREVAGTIKVMAKDNILVELSGNQVTATSKIWVKPLLNFQNPSNVTFSACKYWDIPQNFLT